MACGKSRNNIILISLGLFFFSLGLCTNYENPNIQKYSISPSGNRRWIHGKLIIGQKTEQFGESKEATDMDYQSDMIWDVPEQKMGQEYDFQGYDNTAVEQLLEMKPMVDCSSGQMRLQVNEAYSKPGSLLFVDRSDLKPLSPSKLPKSCGYKVSSTRHNFVMLAPYDGCFVLVEESCYVLPLLWFGLPVQMSCPVSLPSYSTPMVTCYPGRMDLTTDWTSELLQIKVNLKNQWEPLIQVSADCNIGVYERSEGIILSFPYKSPCVEKEDGMHNVKLSGDIDINVSCPTLAPTGSQKFIIDGQISTPTPTQTVKNTPPGLQFDFPDTSEIPSNKLDENYHWHGQPIDNNVEKPFYLTYPAWYWSEPQPLPPHLPHKPVKSEEPPLPIAPIKPDGSPYYVCSFYPPTEEPEVIATTASPPATVPQYYQNFGPYYHPYPLPEKPKVPTPTTASPPGTVPQYYQHFGLYYHPHPFPEEPEVPATTASPPATVSQYYQHFGPYYHPHPLPYLPHPTPTPSTQKPQDPPVSGPGTVIVFPKYPQSEIKQPLDCLQYCQVGLPDCCPQIAVHQYHYHFVPQHQNGNLQFPLLQTGLKPDSSHVLSQGSQEASVPPSRTTFTNPQLYPIGGPQETQTYHRPQEGNPGALPGNKPREQIDSPPPYHFRPNVYSSHAFDRNLWNHQVQPGSSSAEAPSHYFNFLNPDQSTNQYAPNNIQQSDAPPLPNLLSKIRQYASQAADNENKDVKEPALIFRGQRHTRLGSHGTLQVQHSSNTQPSDALKRTQREYVLLKHGPPGKESSGTPPSPVVELLDNVGENFAGNFPNEPLNLKAESEDSKRHDGKDMGNAGQTFRDQSGTLPQSDNLALSHGQASDQSFRYYQRLFPPFDTRPRTLEHDVSQ